MPYQHCTLLQVHERGPQEIILEPSLHVSIHLHSAIKLAANEAIVVYRRQEVAESSSHGVGAPALVAKLEVVSAAASTASKAVEIGGTPTVGKAVPSPRLLTAESAGQEGAVHVERRIVHGPAVFMPESSEWWAVLCISHTVSHTYSPCGLTCPSRANGARQSTKRALLEYLGSHTLRLFHPCLRLLPNARSFSPSLPPRSPPSPAMRV